MADQPAFARSSFWTALVPTLALLIGVIPRIGSAQNPYTEDGYNGAGIVRLIDWPGSLVEAAEALPDAADVRDRIYRADLLPFIDTLALGYSYAVEADQPLMSFAIDWGRGAFGIVEGQRVHDALMPADVRMTAVELKASVHVNGRPATELFIVVDSMALAPRPDVYTFDVFGLAWDQIFDDTPAGEARAYFEQGFTLTDLEVVRIEFHEFVEDEAGGPPLVRRPRRSDRNPGVVIVDDFHGGIHLGIGGWRGPRLPKDGPPRGDDMGRGQTGESGVTRGGNRGSDGETRPSTPETDAPSDETPSRTRTERDRSDDERATRGDDERTTKSDSGRSWPFGRSDNDDDDDDDDDDEASLLPAAAGGAAAVAALVVAGGTVGYYGNGKAPVGLTAGYVRSRGGFLLEVGVNAAVLEQSEQDAERFIARGVMFYDVFGSRIQPAIGLGAYVEEFGGDTDITPDLSVGVVANLGKVLLQGGYDVTAGGLDFGIAFNFRHRPRR